MRRRLTVPPGRAGLPGSAGPAAPVSWGAPGPGSAPRRMEELPVPRQMEELPLPSPAPGPPPALAALPERPAASARARPWPSAACQNFSL